MRAREILKLIPPHQRHNWVLKCEGRDCYNARTLRGMFLLTKEVRLVCYDCLVYFLITGGDKDSIMVYT